MLGSVKFIGYDLPSILLDSSNYSLSIISYLPNLPFLSLSSTIPFIPQVQSDDKARPIHRYSNLETF